MRKISTNPELPAHFSIQKQSYWLQLIAKKGRCKQPSSRAVFFYRNNGFTLLEVMIAVAIIAISVVSLMGLQAQSVSMADISRFQLTAALLAQKKISELELTDFETLGSETGVFESPFATYRYEVEVAALEEDDVGIPGADKLLKSIELVVSLEPETESQFYLRAIIMDNRETKK